MRSGRARSSKPKRTSSGFSGRTSARPGSATSSRLPGGWKRDRRGRGGGSHVVTIACFRIISTTHCSAEGAWGGSCRPRDWSERASERPPNALSSEGPGTSAGILSMKGPRARFPSSRSLSHSAPEARMCHAVRSRSSASGLWCSSPPAPPAPSAVGPRSFMSRKETGLRCNWTAADS